MIYKWNFDTIHTGNMPTNLEHLKTLQRELARVMDAYYYSRNIRTVETQFPFNEKHIDDRDKVMYDKRSVQVGETGLGIEVLGSKSHHRSVLHITNSTDISALLKDVHIKPEEIKRLVGREIFMHKDKNGAMYGIELHLH